MIVNDSQSAQRYVNSWKNERSSRRVTYLTLAIEGLETSRSILEHKKDQYREEYLNLCEAIGVLRSARCKLVNG